MSDAISPMTPVIVGVGEAIDRPETLQSLEPARLMADALRAAEADAAPGLLHRIEALDTIGEVSWPYDDAAGLVAAMLGIAPRLSENGPVGGESPMRYLHSAALRIQRGEIEAAAVCGAEAEYTLRRAAREGREPDGWATRSSAPAPHRAGDSQRAAVRALEAFMPINVYPLYESATRARWGLSFPEAQDESARAWAGLSQVAASRAFAWQQRHFDADTIATPTPDNRMVTWPYPKQMIANPVVNQGAAVIVTSYDLALRSGIAPERMVFFRGGHAANEPDDLLLRQSFDGAWAMREVLHRTLADAGSQPIDLVELYSCFPVVPKMARRVLGMAPDRPISVTGGLSFFGAPLNNYMSHAAVAMTQALRGRDGTLGLLYAQGGYVTKHHALLLSRAPSPAPLSDDAVHALPAPRFAGSVHDHYEGPATIEACTVLFDRAGAPRHGIVIVRTPDGGRSIARTAPHTATTAALLDTAHEPIGRIGHVIAGDIPDFALA